MNIGDPNQQLAAVWIANVLRDHLAAIDSVWTERDPRQAQLILVEATRTAREALKQFDTIMGDNLRIAEQLTKIELPYDFRRKE